MWVKILGIIGLMWILQGIFTYFQIKNLQEKIKQLKKVGRVGIGSAKGKMTPGNIVLIAADKTGKILEAYRMSGMTVFARFKEIKEMKGLYLQEVPYVLNDKDEGFKKAVENAVKMLQEKNL
ncbi:transcriptional regulator GutM [Thermosediminibacter oceani]|uniref:Glucitol operon activator n=1 Tax=Thermosediminibacter oceani (strain ATCC BAA-1034 / DSM 16646 / JW/IW-1228P) TaxID=555079 RepID=D9RXW6_THEOJ|nr:transcriptional regulator GutM [Thermosediminibacter oceani]ADL08190.1 Glucitol operon activator [Thermosediminibacter oceani DSM 16646]